MDLTKAPEKGILYALFRDRVLYEPYSSDTLSQDMLDTENLLELHLFNEEQEYRYIKTRRNGYQERLICDKVMPHEDVYTEEILLLRKDSEKQENLKDTVKVVNYIVYDENDLMRISGYRLQEVK